MIVRNWDVLGKTKLEDRKQAITETNDDMVFRGIVVLLILRLVVNYIMFNRDKMFSRLYRTGEPSCLAKSGND
jgi:hypothetical protein